MRDSPPQLKMTPKAAESFRDYVNLGPSRSLAKLVQLYTDTGQSVTKASPTHRLPTLKEWSVKYAWQERIAQAITERGMQLLAEATELDTETFLSTSREYHKRLISEKIGKMSLGALGEVRSQVRRKDSGGGQTINVVIVQEAERLATELGVSADELIADAELIAKAAWDRKAP